MRQGTFYLNNRGSRWVVLPKEKVLVFHGAAGYCKMRTVEFYSSWGSFGKAHLRYKGKMISAFLEDMNGTTVFFVDYKEQYSNPMEEKMRRDNSDLQEDSATERYYGN